MLTEGQSSEGKQVDGQKTFGGVEMMAKLARKLKPISNSNHVRVALRVISAGTETTGGLVSLTVT
jgi:hypothetical protein